MDLFDGLKSFRHINEADDDAQSLGLYVYDVDVSKLKDDDYAQLVAQLDHAEIKGVFEEKSCQIMTKKDTEELRAFFGENDKTKDLPFELVPVKQWHANLFANLTPEERELVANQYTENDPEELPEILGKALKDVNDKLIALDARMQNSADETTEELMATRTELEKQAGALTSVGKNVEDILALLKAKKPLRKKAAGGAKKETVNEKLEKFMNTFTKQLEAVEKRRDKVNSDLLKKFDEHSKDMAAKMDEMAKKDDIDALKIYLAGELSKMNQMKQKNVITEDRLKELINSINNAKQKTKQSDEELQKQAKLAKPAEVATKIYMWNRQVHKDADGVKEDYMHLAALVAGLKKDYPDDYEEMKKYLEESAKTKYGLIGALQSAGSTASTAAKPEAKTEKDADDKEIDKDSPEGAKTADGVEVDLGKKERLKGNIYDYVFILKLGERKHYTNLEKLKGEAESEHEDVLTPSLINKISNMGHDLLGYEPQGYITAYIAKYDDTRDFLGTALQFTTKNSVGILAAIAGGGAGFLAGKSKEFAKDGLDFGENIGKYIRYEMTGEVKDLNPVVADVENKIRDKFNIEDRVRYDYENAKKRRDITIKRRATKYLTDKGHPFAAKETTHPSVTRKVYTTVREDVGIGGMGMEPVGPNDNGGFGSMCTNFNVPAMINGMGDPKPATKTEKGTGDKFPILNVKKKKKKLKPVNEDIMDFDSFCKINK